MKTQSTIAISRRALSTVSTVSSVSSVSSVSTVSSVSSVSFNSNQPQPSLLKFVPPHIPANSTDSERLRDFIFTKKKLLCLTGAGISTESGIPDYRSEGVGLYATSKKRPMQYTDFISSEAFRQRYWARNFIGWPSFAALRPNNSHQFLADLEQRHPDILLWLVTQNVDSLHVKAGSQRITELHGTAFKVICLSCGHTTPRTEYQSELRALNPGFQVAQPVLRPDADVDLSDEEIAQFKVASCGKCGEGVMKPFIVYFGENVPKSRVDFLYEKVDECDGLLVMGSSLQVYSGYRFATRAAEQKKPICIVNIGSTRADHLSTLRFDRVRCGDLLANVKI